MRASSCSSIFRRFLLWRRCRESIGVHAAASTVLSCLPPEPALALVVAVPLEEEGVDGNGKSVAEKYYHYAVSSSGAWLVVVVMVMVLTTFFVKEGCCCFL